MIEMDNPTFPKNITDIFFKQIKDRLSNNDIYSFRIIGEERRFKSSFTINLNQAVKNIPNPQRERVVINHVQRYKNNSTLSGDKLFKELRVDSI